jgi:hypothetical protein
VFIILVCNAHLLEVIEAGLEWVILHIPAFSRLSPGIMSALGNAKDRFNGQVVAKVSQVHEQLLFFLFLIKTRPFSLWSSASIKYVLLKVVLCGSPCKGGSQLRLYGIQLCFSQWLAFWHQSLHQWHRAS